MAAQQNEIAILEDLLHYFRSPVGTLLLINCPVECANDVAELVRMAYLFLVRKFADSHPRRRIDLGDYYESLIRDLMHFAYVNLRPSPLFDIMTLLGPRLDGSGWVA